jgi:hypothetical protein
MAPARCVRGRFGVTAPAALAVSSARKGGMAKAFFVGHADGRGKARDYTTRPRSSADGLRGSLRGRSKLRPREERSASSASSALQSFSRTTPSPFRPSSRRTQGTVAFYETIGRSPAARAARGRPAGALVSDQSDRARDQCGQDCRNAPVVLSADRTDSGITHYRYSSCPLPPRLVLPIPAEERSCSFPSSCEVARP